MGFFIGGVKVDEFDMMKDEMERDKEQDYIEQLEQQNAKLVELIDEVIEHGYIENDWYDKALKTLAEVKGE
jgi:hypothetical protein